MDIEEIRRIPVADFLQRLGHLPTRRQGNRLWYLAPYRKEKGASFNVNLSRNVWFDFGLGKGGDIFSLAGMMMNSCDFKEQAKFINGCFNAVPPKWRQPKYPLYNKVEQPAFEAVEYRPLASYELLRYLKGRGIPKEVAAAHCEEVRYRSHGKPYFGIAFRNIGGGCEVRSQYFKGCIPPKDISLVANGSPACHIYEGLMDYLSAMTLNIGICEDHLVLNSVSNLEKAFAHLDGYSHIKCHLDNDDAGRRTLAALRKHFEGTEAQVSDCSGLYRGHKDLNDYLQTTTIKKETK